MTDTTVVSPEPASLENPELHPEDPVDASSAEESSDAASEEAETARPSQRTTLGKPVSTKNGARKKPLKKVAPINALSGLNAAIRALEKRCTEKVGALPEGGWALIVRCDRVDRKSKHDTIHRIVGTSAMRAALEEVADDVLDAYDDE